MVGFPTDFRLTAVLHGRAYGVATDTMGVERIRVYESPVEEVAR